MERSFNLIDEAWISVITEDCKIQDISLREALLNAHNYAGLSGETKTQDFAILRLLLALMYTIFYRYDLDGEKIDPADDENITMDNWETMWKKGYIPAAPVEKYFSEWHDRFWLFDDERPFYQTNAAKEKVPQGKNTRGTHFSSAKMIGTLSQSDNRQRLFSDRAEHGIMLSYPEAARWLLNLNCFDDIAAKYNDKAANIIMQVPARAWVGNLGLIAVKGKTLFETIMLNFCAEYDLEHNVFKENPSWENDNRNSDFKRLIPVPKNQAALLSLMSRRILLCRENNTVNGYYLYGGDYFENDEVFQEQMTLWGDSKSKNKKFKKSKNDKSKINPLKLETQIWREFENIARLKKEDDKEKGLHCSGVIARINELIHAGILDDNYMINVTVASVIYNEDQKTSLPVADVISDSLTFHAKLLEDFGEIWRKRIILEIEKCNEAAEQILVLYKELQLAKGLDKDSIPSNFGETEAKVPFYSKIDRPFRLWLEGLKVEQDKVEQDMDSYTISLERELKKIALSLGRSFVAQVGNQTIFRHIKKTDKNGKTIEIKSSAEVYSFFVYNINKIFDKAGEQNENSKQS